MILQEKYFFLHCQILVTTGKQKDASPHCYAQSTSFLGHLHCEELQWHHIDGRRQVRLVLN